MLVDKNYLKRTFKTESMKILIKNYDLAVPDTSLFQGQFHIYPKVEK